MINVLRKYAENLKISDFGVVRARVFDDLCLDLREKPQSEFLKAEAQERCNPFFIMPEAKSIIVCLFSYNNPYNGNISKYAMGIDYHKVIKEKLELFSEPLKAKGYKTLVFADSWNMNERYLAKRAGLGFIGRNNMLINPKWGSYVFVGAILTDCVLEENTPLNAGCINCGKCIKNCPSGALGEEGFSENKCLSYITQKKGELSEEEREKIRKNKMVWGCDVCQGVCPHNKNAPYSEIEEFSENLITDLEFEHSLSNKEFKIKYGDRAFSWRGLAPLKRNYELVKK